MSIRYLLFVVCMLLIGCNQHISVQTDYLSRTQLASWYVGTPDPSLQYPLIGERMLVEWDLPQDYFVCDELILSITIRYADRSEEVKIIPVTCQKGWYRYELSGEEFEKNGGFLTYKVDVIGDDQILETWRHQLWVELIVLDNPVEE